MNAGLKNIIRKFAKYYPEILKKMSKINSNFPLKDYLKCKDGVKPGFGTCIACSKLVSWSRSKIISHNTSKNCTGISDSDVNLFRGLKSVQTVQIHTVQVETVNEMTSGTSGQQMTSSGGENVLTRRIDHLTLEEKKRCDAAVATFFHQSSIPLSIADVSPCFKNLIKTLRPAYADHLPSSKVIGGTMLDEEYNRIKQANLEKIRKAKCYSIVTDGWSNIRNEHIINFIVVIPNEKPIFYKVCIVYYYKIESNCSAFRYCKEKKN